MYPNLSDKEINAVIKSVLAKRKEKSLELYLNQERRILFNPNSLLTSKQKMDFVNKELGKLKSEQTKETIYMVLENWDFEADGKITQAKVINYVNRSIQTIKKHWSDFKSYVKWMNSGENLSPYIASIEPEISIPQPIQYRLEDEINLYVVLPSISFTKKESTSIILDLKGARIKMGELVQYIGKQRKQQQYNDYKGIPITAERVVALKAIIAA